MAAPPLAQPVDEQQLVQRIRAGDRNAFDQLVRLYFTPLRSFARGLVGAGEASEIVQDLFWNIWRMREGWQVRSSVSSYLYNGVHKLALNVHRRARVHDRWQQGALAREDTIVVGTKPVSGAERVEALEIEVAVRRAIARMPARRQQVAILRFLHDYSCPQIAQALGISTKAAERQAANALATLRTSLRHLID